MIHPAILKDRVAVRYYNQYQRLYCFDETNPLDREKARKRFFGDKNIDLKILKEVIRDIYREQLTMIK